MKQPQLPPHHLAGADEASAEGDGERLDAILRAELLVDAAEVVFHGVFADAHLFGDFAV